MNFLKPKLLLALTMLSSTWVTAQENKRYIKIVDSLEVSQQYKQATDFFIAEIKKKPKDLEALYYLAKFFAKQEKLEQSQATINKALLLQPQYALGYYLKANIKAQQDSAAEALKLINKAIDIDKNTAKYYSLRAFLYQKTKGSEILMLADLNKAIALEPQNHKFT
jgi:tetratricopeptide (TPR) repeat protein